MQCLAIIIGGGVAGGFAALSISRGGGSAVLIEAAERAEWRIGETLRPEARSILKALGLWEEFQKVDHLPSYGHASSWGSKELVEKDFLFNPHGNAWQLDRAKFDEMILTEAAKRDINIYRGLTITGAARQNGRWELTVGGSVIRARWLIDATGRRSTLGRFLGVKRKLLDHLVAINTIASSPSQTDQDGRTLIESCPYGWWYSTLMPTKRRTVLFQTDAYLLPGQKWREKRWLETRFRETVNLRRLLEQHGYVFHERVKLTSAHSGRLQHFCGKGWLAVGDAAMSFDPLSGQGILKAMQSGLKAAEVVLHDTAAYLKSYSEWSEAMWTEFVEARRKYYGLEQRWVNQLFWFQRSRLNM